MKYLLAALALVAIAAAVKARRVGDALSVEPDDDIVGMPTTWDERLLASLGLDPERFYIELPGGLMTRGRTDWDSWFRENVARNPDWRN